MKVKTMTGLLMLLCWSGSLFQGFYYEQSYLIVGIVLILGFTGFTLWHSEIHFSLFHLPIVFMAIQYGVSILYAVDREQAILEAAKFGLLVPWALIVTSVPLMQRIDYLKSWTWAGAGLVVWGLLFQLERKGRLESTLEYANTLAIVLLVGLLSGLFFYVIQKKKRYLILVGILGAGLLLTYSRSVWILWLLSVSTSFFLLPEFRKRAAWIGAICAHFLSFLIAATIKQDPLFFWSRMQSIQPQTSEFQIRLVYWKDSLRIIKDYGWTGSGGGGWVVLQQLYRSKEYFVKYVHNHFLQITMEIGYLGLLAFFVWIGWFYLKAWSFIKVKSMAENELYWLKAAMMMVTIILLHAGFDFDLSFPWVFMLLLFLASFAEMPINKRFTRVMKVKSSLLKAFVAAIAIVMIALLGWLEWGYACKRVGTNLVVSGQLNEGQVYLERAERALPWSHSVKYEFAKSYVLLGNKSGDLNSYFKAKEKIQAALDILPQEGLYRSLMEDLKHLRQ